LWIALFDVAEVSVAGSRFVCMTGVTGESSAAGMPRGGRVPAVDFLRAGADEVRAELTGADLAVALASVDTTALNDHDLVEQVKSWERLIAWATAGQLAAIADFARRPARIDLVGADRGAQTSARASWAPLGARARESADLELSAALAMPRVTVATKLDVATTLARSLPATREALAAGQIDYGRARVITEATGPLARADAAAVEAWVLPGAGRRPTARLRRSVGRAVLAVDPVAAKARAVRARAQRRFTHVPLPDAVAEITALLDAETAATISSVVDAGARALRAGRAPGDTRGMEQLRADVFAAPFLRAADTGVLDGLVPIRLGAGRGGRRVGVQVTVAASTLAGLDDQPADLERHGPIPAELARSLAADPDRAWWWRVLTDDSGCVLDVGTTVYRPPASMARLVAARDQRCQAPGCNQLASRSDQDHLVAFPGGPTSAANLRTLCRSHHRLKQQPTVRVEAIERDDDPGANGDDAGGGVGVLDRPPPQPPTVLGTRWVMPTGHVYDEFPEPVAEPSDSVDCGEGRAPQRRSTGTDPPFDPD
jgi:hypothetical protein